MRLTRLIAGAISASLLGLVPVALTAGTAHAADLTTVTTLEASRNVLEFKSGYSPFITGAVKDSSGSSVYEGTVDLLAKPGKAKWRKIATKDASGYLSFSDVKPKKNTQYRLVYNGGASSSNTYQESTSKTLSIKVIRKVTLKITNSRTGMLKGKIAPKFAKKRVVIHKKVGKKWKKYAKPKTNKKSVFKVKIRTNRKGHKFRFTIKGNKNYAKTVVTAGYKRY